MRIRLKTRMAGPGGTYEPGAVLSHLSQADAVHLVASGQAEALDPPQAPAPERAAVKPKETRADGTPSAAGKKRRTRKPSA